MALAQRGGVVESQYLAVVAIDFGTSRSGIALAICGKEGIHILGPRGKGYENDKVRTSVLIDADTRKVLAFGIDALKQHMDEGFPASQLLFQHVKMNLLNSQSADPTIESSGKGQSLPLLEVIGSILNFFKEFAMAQIRERFAVHLAPHQILWNLTVPAIWSEYGRDFMRRAAVCGGLITDPCSTLLMLQPEPEAAALYAAEHQSDILRFDRGTRFMIVDAGGGTVDITAYEVYEVQTRPGHTPRPKLKELMIPAGGPWGSEYVDEQFEKFVKLLIGKPAYKLYKASPQRVEFLNTYWEPVKKCISSERAEFQINLAIPLSFIPDANLAEVLQTASWKTPKFKPLRVSRGATVFVSTEQILSWFQPLITATLGKVTELLQRPELSGIQYIIKVGGFSQCKPLHEALHHAFTSAKVQVIDVQNPGAAVLWGAVLAGLCPAEIVDVRKPTGTIGMAISRDFKPGMPERHRITTKAGKEKCDYCFCEFINVQQELVTNVTPPVVQNFYPLEPDAESIRVQIYKSPEKRVEYTDDPGCVKLGELKCVVAKRGDKPDEEARKITVEMRFDLTEIRVKVTSAVTGKEINAKCLTYVPA
eukprot:TRINITY_DN2880_c0_g1_i2.p1 TRINITY_DN2880_c0_g1~~TRINITY_DN2880_c0_g1_i2.p1  ORF type:complete len:592 (-),score=127.51 TRINITY_DN2880_c0_g1_i2:81-1856(-)